MTEHKNLTIWNISHEITLEVFKLTNNFPSSEKYTLVSQIRRAAYSMPSNIAEGSSRSSQKDFYRFLEISLGSAKELEYFLLLSNELNYINASDYDAINKRVLDFIKMTTVFMKKVSSNINS